MYVVMDCATGGNDSETHSLLALSVIKTTLSYEPVDELHLHLKHPLFCVTTEALKNNHIDLGDPTGMTSIPDAKAALFKFLGMNTDQAAAMLAGQAPASRSGKARLPLVGINISYDIPFIKKFLTEPVYDSLFKWRPIDVLSSFENLYSAGVVREPKSASIAGLAEALGISVNTDRVHEPRYASRLTVKIARAVNQKGLKLGKLVARYGHSVAGLMDDPETAARNRAMEKTRDEIPD